LWWNAVIRGLSSPVAWSGVLDYFLVSFHFPASLCTSFFQGMALRKIWRWFFFKSSFKFRKTKFRIFL